MDEIKKIKGQPLWTTSIPVSGDLLKAKDFPRDLKDRYERVNLNEESKNV